MRWMLFLSFVLLACRAETALIVPSQPPSELPDLVVSYSIYYDPEKCGVQGYIDEVMVANMGAADAGAFVVEINGVRLPEIPSLAVGEWIQFALDDVAMAGVQVMADVEQVIVEIDEDNNFGQWSSMTSVFVIPCPTPTTVTN